MYEHILAEARQSVWLMRLDKLQAIMGVLQDRAAGVTASAEVLAAMARDNQTRRQGVKRGSVAVLPVIGSIVQRGNFFTEASGTASTDVLSRQFDELVADESVSAIVLEYDTPGGTVYGIPELADKILAARGKKPLVAQVNAEAASAGYWLASTADEIVVTPSGAVGSIGAYALHLDRTAQDEMLGERYEYISYGKYKTEGNPHEPLTDEGRTDIQATVDRWGKLFEKTIAANRGVSVETVRKDWGQGRMLDAERAVAVGMADRVATLEQTIERLASGRARVKSRAKIENAKKLLGV